MFNQREIMRMMQRMGMNMKEIKAKKVIIETEDGNIIINEPSVSKIVAQGKSIYQISGAEEIESFSKEDINIVKEKTGVNEEDAKEALKKSKGDIAEAIMMLQAQKDNEQ